MSAKDKKLTAAQRLELLFDGGAYTEIDAGNNTCGAVAAFGSVGGASVFAFVQDSAVNGAAVDMAQARKLAKVYDLAAKTGSPVVTVYDSNGVKLSGDGCELMMAMSEITRKSSELSGVVPQLAVVLGGCGGFMSLCAALADLCIVTPAAELYLTSDFNDKAAGGSEKNVGTAEYAAKAGVAAIECADEEEALAKAAELVELFPLNNLADLPYFEYSEPEGADDAAAAVCDADSAVELYAAFGEGCKVALATVGGVPCGIIDVKGALTREDTAKAARLVEVCDSFSLPVVSIVDSCGTVKSAENDRLGGIRSAAKLANVLAEATCAKVTVINGSCIGNAYTIFGGKNGGADMTYAVEGSVISPVSCEAAVDLFWHEKITKESDIPVLAKQYAAEIASAEKAAAVGAVDSVITKENLRATVVGALVMLSSKRASRLPKKHGNLPL